MSAHRLTIAKATFQAGLLRPDASCAPVARDEIASFHRSLEEMLARCSPDNVQRTKSWCLKHLVSSATRLGALGKLLLAVSKAQDQEEDKQNGSPGRATWSRRRLHVLYLLNDLLHHTKHHGLEQSVHIQLTSALQPYLPEAIGLAASSASDADKKVLQKLQNLLGLWSEEGHYAAQYISRLCEAVDQAPAAGSAAATQPEHPTSNGASAATLTPHDTKDAPFVMPAYHGDTSAPYYDLPAANMMPHIMPNSTVPISTQLMKPLQFVAGPADPALAAAVGTFLTEVDRIYDASTAVHDDEGIVADIDDMGQTVRKDEQTGEILNGETYYGWSRDFCERMKKRRREGPPKEDVRGGRGRSISDSRSRSRSRDSGRRKRRRYSDSRSRSRSNSRSRSRPRFGTLAGRRSSRSTSHSPRRGFTSDRREQTPPPPPQDFRPPPQPFPPTAPVPLSSSPFSPAFNAPFGLDPNGIPIPPPRPAGWQGPWPPIPPPPPPLGMAGMPPIPLPQGAGFVAPPPLPNAGMGIGYAQGQNGPSPPSYGVQQQAQSSPPSDPGRWQGQQNSQGRGGWGGYGNSRDRGRGR